MASLRARVSDQVRKLNAREIPIISNNCIAGILYELAGLPKQSPTAGLYFHGPAYAQFLDDLGSDRLQPWIDIEPSDLVYKDDQHCWAYAVPSGGHIVFLHYSTPEEAIGKWRRRIERLSGRAPLVISSIRDSITAESIEAPLRKFRFSFVADGNPAPAADALILKRPFLKSFSAYLDSVLHEQPGGTNHVGGDR